LSCILEVKDVASPWSSSLLCLVRIP
jgi:hypothetical protein